MDLQVKDFKVYIAGSSAASERERIRAWHERLRSLGITVTSTWLEAVDAAGEANPRAWLKERRKEYAIADLAAAMGADLVWFLVPPIETATRGAWGELCAAYVERQYAQNTLVASGDTKQSIFCALAAEFTNDLDAFIFILNKIKPPAELGWIEAATKTRDADAAPLEILTSSKIEPIRRGCVGHTPRADLRGGPLTDWRVDAWRNMVEIVDGLRDRGFSIAGYDPTQPVPRIVSARLDRDPMIKGQISVSTIKHEPYILGMEDVPHEGWPGTTLIRNHALTSAQLLREVDACLAGRASGLRRS